MIRGLALERVHNTYVLHRARRPPRTAWPRVETGILPPAVGATARVSDVDVATRHCICRVVYN
jgi:hypothetical protein